MPRTNNLAAFLSAIERHPGSIVGRNEFDGRYVLALPRLTEDHRMKSLYGMVLRWSPEGTTELVAPGVWLVDLNALSAEVALKQDATAAGGLEAALARL